MRGPYRPLQAFPFQGPGPGMTEPPERLLWGFQGYLRCLAFTITRKATKRLKALLQCHDSSPSVIWSQRAMTGEPDGIVS